MIANQLSKVITEREVNTMRHRVIAALATLVAAAAFLGASQGWGP
jgi:hypothetical protein